ncbi:MAG: LysM peptidoglycan-binding domain-containing protein [bacterium]|nr:LysM peptidoglycan-binding domain-containing protein [bacterium]
MQAARAHRVGWLLAAALVVGFCARATAAPPPTRGENPAGGSARAAARLNPTHPTAFDYTVQPGDNLNRICSRLRERTGHYSLDDMIAAIRRANDLQTNLLRPGTVLRIPAVGNAITAVVPRTVADGAEVRGIYLNGPACGVGSVLQRVDRFIAAGGNTVVFDAKDIDGAVSYASKAELAGWGPERTSPVIPSLPAMLDQFHRRGLHVVARLAVFLDANLGQRRPDLALRGPEGAPWDERGCTWLDPAHPEVHAYHLALARELAAAGVDEIQLDYVRYPTNGWRGDWQGDLARTASRRQEVVAGFLAAVRDSLAGTDVLLSADLFGIMAWERTEDLALTGQHVPTLARLVDVICPMIYPSHFAPGFEGRRQPADEPAWLVGEATRRFRQLAGPDVGVRPWLQAFPWRVPSFDGGYVAAQVEAARAAGADGWCLWNPASQYEAALEVMPALCAPVPVAVTAFAAPGAAKRAR